MKKEIISGIYCIENMVNGKKYIGLAVNINKRVQDHFRKLNTGKHINSYFQNAWNKHGEENFKSWIIAEYPRDETILKLMEIYFICYYDSFWDDGRGYNLTRGGDGAFGYIPSDATRNLLSIARSGENNPNYGKRMSDEQKRKMSEARKNPSEEARKAMRDSHKNISQETRKRMSDAHSGKNHHMWGKHLSDKTKKRISEGNLGKRLSEKTRKLISIASSGKNHSSYGKFGRDHTSFGKKPKNASSQYFGVSKTSGKKVCWQVYVGKKYIGTFKIEIEAARIYDKYVIENNIDRPLNFPEDYNQ